MGKVWTGFVKPHAKANLWLSLYILIQCLVMLGVMIFYIFNNQNFAYEFYYIFAPIVEMPDSYEKNIKSYEGLLKLFHGRMGVVLLVSTLLMVLICGIYWYKTHDKADIKFSRIDITCLVLYGMLLNIIISYIVIVLPRNISGSHDALTGLAVSNGIVLDVLATGILAPIGEELLFRYCLLKAIQKINVKYAILYQAIIFGLLHGNLVQGIYGFALGVLFGTLTIRTGSLLPSIMLHITINLGSVLSVYLFHDDLTGLFVFFFVFMALYFIQRIDIFKKKL